MRTTTHPTAARYEYRVTKFRNGWPTTYRHYQRQGAAVKAADKHARLKERHDAGEVDCWDTSWNGDPDAERCRVCLGDTFTAIVERRVVGPWEPQ